jgi:hypothetical protein
MTNLRTGRIIVGASIATVFGLGLMGHMIYKDFQFDRADRNARNAAEVHYIQEHKGGVPMTLTRREMYQKMQREYQEAMGDRYDVDRDPYIPLAR